MTIITPSLWRRTAQLIEACDTVMAQTVQPEAHLIGVDIGHKGPAAVRNQLLAAVETEHVAFLDDDDLLDPHHLETLLNSDADVVIPHCRFSNRVLPEKYYNQPYDREVLRDHGIFGITVLARTIAVMEAGGFGQERYEDWELWNRMADNGCTFEVIPVVTWTYRLGPGSRTYE